MNNSDVCPVLGCPRLRVLLGRRTRRPPNHLSSLGQPFPSWKGSSGVPRLGGTSVLDYVDSVLTDNRVSDHSSCVLSGHRSVKGTNYQNLMSGSHRGSESMRTYRRPLVVSRLRSFLVQNDTTGEEGSHKPWGTTVRGRQTDLPRV